MRKSSVEHAMTNSFGFGGTNASLILSRYRNGKSQPDKPENILLNKSFANMLSDKTR
jgi:acyl transferase domain-containing protein